MIKLVTPVLTAAQGAGALEFVKFLTAPAALPVIEKRGMEPVP